MPLNRLGNRMSFLADIEQAHPIQQGGTVVQGSVVPSEYTNHLRAE